MAACGLGTSSINVPNLELGSVTPKLSNLQRFQCSRDLKIARFGGLVLANRSRKVMMQGRSSKSEADSTTSLEESLEEIVSSDGQSTLIPNSLELESLLTVLCDTKSIAEFELKLGGFQLSVTRLMAEQSASPQPHPPAPVTAHSVAETSSPSLALAKTVPSSGGVQTLLDKAVDEGLMILKSPRVGYFRRSRTIKGKRAPPSCKEKDTVKEGQVLCYIEQLGGEIPIESDISGEVVKILKKDGDPVGYGDALIAVLPSFPGIM